MPFQFHRSIEDVLGVRMSTSYELFMRKVRNDRLLELNDDKLPHIAEQVIDIYHQWQRTKRKPWAWNDAHRRLTRFAETTDAVPIHEGACREYIRRMRYLGGLSFLSIYFQNEKREAMSRIRFIFYLRRLAERRRLLNKRRWWVHNTIGTRYNPGFVRPEPFGYNQWMQSKTVPTLWLHFAIEEGLTYRHIRVSGYRLYVDLADDLRDEYDRIREVATERKRRYLERRMLS
jgi:hypothetical protein